MKNIQQKNHQVSQKPFGLQTGKLILSDGFQKQYSLLRKTESHYGAPGKVKQNLTMQTRKLSATDGLAIIYDKTTIIISRVF